MRSVLVLVDGSSSSLDILDDAIRVAGDGGQLFLLHARATSARRPLESYDPDSPRAHVDTEYLDAIAEGLRTRGVQVEVIQPGGSASREGRPGVPPLHEGDVIGDAVRRAGADMIACGLHGRGTMAAVARETGVWHALAGSAVPLLLRLASPFRASWPEAPDRRILVPFDGSELALRALPLARDLSREWSAPVDLVSVLPPNSSDVDMEHARTVIELAARRAGKASAHIVVGYPVEELCAFGRAARVTDVVMASHGRTGLSRVLMGSVAHDLIHRLPLPVFVVPTHVPIAKEALDAQSEGLVEANQR
jgi:nucleotide-binding universal stress UspA family protein